MCTLVSATLLHTSQNRGTTFFKYGKGFWFLEVLLSLKKTGTGAYAPAVHASMRLNTLSSGNLQTERMGGAH